MNSINLKKDFVKKKFTQKGAKRNIKEQPKLVGNHIVQSQEKALVKSLKEFCTVEKFIKYLYSPCCPSSIGVARILFGLMMVIDIPDERGLSEIDLRYGDPMKCHFPLFNWIKPLPIEYMGILYFIMWLGAAGICLGYKFHLSCIIFTVPYWYIFLLDKTTWNNHSYLYGLLSILFTFSSAHHTFSLDTVYDPSIKNKPVPLWNYAILRFQFFLLYFYAGVKKLDLDWIGGHSMTKLSMHWVFDPFRLIFTNDQIDFWIIHLFGFFFDLTVGFFLLIDKTRPIAIFFSSAFHLMNSRMFYIGQFPYVCLFMTPIFCSYDWPDRFWKSITLIFNKYNKTYKSIMLEDCKKSSPQLNDISWRQKLTFYLLVSYIGTQLFLPFSHFITKGYNNWTNGIYGYSWDMMVHNWDSILTVIKVIDNDSGEEFYLDPEAWVENSRFMQHGDMLIQYAYCLKRNLPDLSAHEPRLKSKFHNISVYADIWCSLNGRFQQRMFDPRQDLMKAEWSPFEKISWLMPLQSDLTSWREKMSDMEHKILQQSEGNGLLFVADFPGLYLDNYISPELTNVTLTVLQGVVIVEKKVQNNGSDSSTVIRNETLHQGDTGTIVSGEFHKVYTISDNTSCYMYSYVNHTLPIIKDIYDAGSLKESDSLLNSLKIRIDNLFDSFLILSKCFNKFLYNTPVPIRN